MPGRRLEMKDEELKTESKTASGIMRPDTGALRVPSDLSEGDKTRSLLPNRVVLSITLMALLFIAIIAWFVSQMPTKN